MAREWFIDWMERHGPAIRAVIAREMPDEPEREVEAITEAVVARVLYGVDDRPAIDDPGTVRWLEDLTRAVCEDVRQLDVRPWAPPDPVALQKAARQRKYEEFQRLNAAYPTGTPWLDRYVEHMREWYGLAVGALVLLGKRLRQTVENGARTVQDRVALQMAAIGEVQAALPAAAPMAKQALAGGLGVLTFLAGPAAVAAPGNEPPPPTQVAAMATTRSVPSAPPSVADGTPRPRTRPPMAPLSRASPKTSRRPNRPLVRQQTMPPSSTPALQRPRPRLWHLNLAGASGRRTTTPSNGVTKTAATATSLRETTSCRWMSMWMGTGPPSSAHHPMPLSTVPSRRLAGPPQPLLAPSLKSWRGRVDHVPPPLPSRRPVSQSTS